MHDKYDEAIANAKAGSLDAIPGSLMVRYHHYFQSLAATYAPVPDADGPTGLWVVGGGQLLTSRYQVILASQLVSEGPCQSGDQAAASFAVGSRAGGGACPVGRLCAS